MDVSTSLHSRQVRELGGRRPIGRRHATPPLGFRAARAIEPAGAAGRTGSSVKSRDSHGHRSGERRAWVCAKNASSSPGPATRNRRGIGNARCTESAPTKRSAEPRTGAGESLPPNEGVAGSNPAVGLKSLHIATTTWRLIDSLATSPLVNVAWHVRRKCLQIAVSVSVQPRGGDTRDPDAGSIRNHIDSGATATRQRGTGSGISVGSRPYAAVTSPRLRFPVVLNLERHGSVSEKTKRWSVSMPARGPVRHPTAGRAPRACASAESVQLAASGRSAPPIRRGRTD